MLVPFFRALNPALPGAILSGMTDPKPDLQWFQFSLRSLLLLVLFVAVLCSIGVCTHWLVSVAIVLLALGGVAGSIVAGTRRSGNGFLLGALCGIHFCFWTGIVSFFRLFSAPFRLDARSLLGVVLAIVAVLVGGVLGGLLVRPRSGR